MGGKYSSGRTLSLGELRKLEDVAKKELTAADQPAKRNVFLSFVNEDLTDVNLLRGQAKNEDSELEFNDYSVKEPFDSKDADYIKRGIRDRIDQASVTVVFVTEHTAQSRWVEWEIRESLKLGKGVIAMYKGKTPPRTLPPAIKEHGIKLVAWNHKAISAAIDSAARKRNPSQ